MPKHLMPFARMPAAPRAFGTAQAGALALLTGCGGVQSTLAPAGRDAERIAQLFWWMAGGALVIWAAVIGLALYAILRPERDHDEARARLFVIGGGAVVPAVVLFGLLIFGLRELPALLDPGPDDALEIHVRGERWWWRVTYHPPDASSFELANELYLPVGRRTRIVLDSRDVIHSFWVPALAGKIDMFPGRRTRLALEPTRTGVFRGVCAEYCGLSHTWMAFETAVVEPDAFQDWMAEQRRASTSPKGELARSGEASFVELGCGACHAVRGTPAKGTIGPDLTHVGGRRTLGAGTLANDPESFRRFLEHLKTLKPGANMPTFDMLEDRELDALAAYLDGLR